MNKPTKPNTEATATTAANETWLTVNTQTINATAPAPFLLECLVDKQDLLQNLHISERTLHNWRENGTLPFIKLLGKIYYNKYDVQAMLLNNRVCNKPKEKKERKKKEG